MVEFKPQYLLFKYYCEQSQHTENLLIQISRYYTTIITAIIAAAFIVLKEAEGKFVLYVIIGMSTTGFVISILATGIIYSYQVLIREWVKKKNLLEDIVYAMDKTEMINAAYDEIKKLRQQKTLILPFYVGTFIVFSLLFFAMLLIASFFPEHIIDAISKN